MRRGGQKSYKKGSPCTSLHGDRGMGASGAAVPCPGAGRVTGSRRPHPARIRRCVPRGHAGEPSTSSDFGGDICSDIARGLALFNTGQFYAAHDVLEAAWIDSESSSGRMFLHGTLQAAVGLHHLEQRNHNGAMLELGEGLRKLRRFETSECIGECPVTIKLFTADVGGVLQLVQSSLAGLPAALLGDNYAAGQDIFAVHHHQEEKHTGLVIAEDAAGGRSCPLPRIDLEDADIAALLAE